MRNDSVLLRPAMHEDVDALQDLARRSVAALSADFYDVAQTASAIECITTPDLDLIEDGTLLVAEFKGRLVGCGAWSRRKKLYTGSARSADAAEYLDPSTEPARIRAFFVAPEAARQGVARTIFEACRDQAERAGFRTLELIATLPGVPLYERLGFVALEPVELPLTDGTSLPAIRMKMDLLPGPTEPMKRSE